MPITLLASACPLPVVETGYPTLANSENTTGASAYNRVSRSFAAGDISTVPSKTNRNANALDQAFNYGGGCFAILTGIAISIGSGLNVAVSAGLAAIGGPVEVAAQNLAVPNNESRVWLWLTQAGALTYTLSTTAPATRCVLIGSCATSGGSVTAVDTSGVLYFKGGMPWRETADNGAPTDSPSATITFFGQTLGGVFLWDDGAYRSVYEPLAVNKMTIASSDSQTIDSDEQVILNTELTPFTVDGILVIDGELILT